MDWKKAKGTDTAEESNPSVYFHLLCEGEDDAGQKKRHIIFCSVFPFILISPETLGTHQG